MAIFVRARPIAFTPTLPGAIVCTFLEPTSLAAMVGVKTLITGLISRAGTVTLSGLGSATVVPAPSGTDYLWSYLLTPGSAGSLSTTITATDASNGTTDSVAITLTVAAAAALPSVTPLAWLRGHDGPMFTDLGGSTAAAVGA